MYISYTFVVKILKNKVIQREKFNKKVDVITLQKIC